eukprot:1178074-Prorocentrum_minimum.AAC.1
MGGWTCVLSWQVWKPAAKGVYEDRPMSPRQGGGGGGGSGTSAPAAPQPTAPKAYRPPHKQGGIPGMDDGPRYAPDPPCTVIPKREPIV